MDYNNPAERASFNQHAAQGEACDRCGHPGERTCNTCGQWLCEQCQPWPLSECDQCADERTAEEVEG